MDPRGNVLGHSDVLCAYVFATVRLTRLSRLRCREANTLGVRSAYPLASACCGAKVAVVPTILWGHCEDHSCDVAIFCRQSDN